MSQDVWEGGIESCCISKGRVFAWVCKIWKSAGSSFRRAAETEKRARRSTFLNIMTLFSILFAGKVWDEEGTEGNGEGEKGFPRWEGKYGKDDERYKKWIFSCCSFRNKYL